MEKNDALKIVRLGVEDLAEIMEVEKAAFIDPWSVDNFLGELERRLTVPLGIKENGRLLAQCFFWLLPPELHLLNIAVRPEGRGRGLAKKLIEAMLILGRKAGGERVLLEVRRSNTEAISLYAGFGFKTVGVRPNYYDNGEDACLMDLDLTATDKYSVGR